MNGARAAALASLACAGFACAAQPSGCGAAAPSSGTYTLPHRGHDRIYRLYVPPRYQHDVPSRLVVLFHGWGGNEDEFLGDSSVIGEAAARGYVLVAPRGLGSGAPDHSNNSWTFRGSATGLDGKGAAICDTALTPDYRYPSCKAGTARNSCSWTQCQDDDVDFTLALVREVESKLCIDTGHVFATGGSNGGMYVWDLGQNPLSAPVFRALAPVIGLPHRAYLGGPGKPGGMPVMLITGLADKVVPPGNWDDDAFTTTSNDNDRFYYTGATAITKAWAAASGCPVSGKARAFDYGSTNTDCRSYCPAQGTQWPAVLDCRAPMGHAYGLPWSWKLIMDFFDRT